MPKCYQLIGVPGAGKSTWIKNQVWALGLTVVSTDQFVEHYAKTQSKTYSEVFKDYMPVAVELMTSQVVRARKLSHSLIWDQTNTTVASRARKFRMLPEYDHIAVVFATPDPTELARRLAGRPGKNIPADAVRDMISRFQLPTEAEGFKEIRWA